MDLESLKILQTLTDNERLNAREAAARVIVRMAGEPPTRDKFTNAQSAYPAWFSKFVVVLMAVVFVASAMPSLFRVFTAGRDHFQDSITTYRIDEATLNLLDETLISQSDQQQATPSHIALQGAIVGISTFLLSEFLIILSVIVANVYFTGKFRLVFIIPVSMGLAIAYVGNWTVTRPNDLFGWLETIIPPTAVLFLGFIGERLVLDSIQTRHANEVAYQEAYQAYQAIATEPEKSPEWLPRYANALKNALIDANKKGQGATARMNLMNTLTSREWSYLVKRELEELNWYSTIQVESPPTQQAPMPAIEEEKSSSPLLETTPTPIVDVVVEMESPLPFDANEKQESSNGVSLLSDEQNIPEGDDAINPT